MAHSHCTGSGTGTGTGPGLGTEMGKWVWNPMVPVPVPCPCVVHRYLLPWNLEWVIIDLCDFRFEKTLNRHFKVRSQCGYGYIFFTVTIGLHCNKWSHSHCAAAAVKAASCKSKAATAAPCDLF